MYVQSRKFRSNNLYFGNLLRTVINLRNCAWSNKQIELELIKKLMIPSLKKQYYNDVRTMFAYFQIIHLIILKWLIYQHQNHNG